MQSDLFSPRQPSRHRRTREHRSLRPSSPPPSTCYAQGFSRVLADPNYAHHQLGACGCHHDAAGQHALDARAPRPPSSSSRSPSMLRQTLRKRRGAAAAGRRAHARTHYPHNRANTHTHTCARAARSLRDHACGGVVWRSKRPRVGMMLRSAASDMAACGRGWAHLRGANNTIAIHTLLYGRQQPWSTRLPALYK